MSFSVVVIHIRQTIVLAMEKSPPVICPVGRLVTFEEPSQCCRDKNSRESWLMHSSSPHLYHTVVHAMPIAAVTRYNSHTPGHSQYKLLF